MSSPATELVLRGYRADDEPEVLDLLQASLKGAPTGAWSPEFFRWKHLDNPFGASFMLLAEIEGELVGLRAFMRWRWASGSGHLHAVRAVDTATHPDHQGKGIFTKITLAALKELEGSTDFVFNTPNDKSLPGYLKMGWREVGTLRVALRVRRPVRVVSGGRRGRAPRTPAAPEGAVAAGDAFHDEDRLADLLARAEAGPGLRTERTPEFLRWRYSPPGIRYWAVTHSDGGRLRGMVLFRLRERGRLQENSIVDLIAERGDERGASRLLRKAVAAAPTDHATCYFSPGGTAASAARRAGFVPSPRGLTFVVNPLRERIDPEPTDLRSWALTLGDVELF